MRLFISLNPDKKVCEDVFRIQKELKKRISAVKNYYSECIKWEGIDKFHITLFFIGDVTPVKCSGIDALLNAAAGAFKEEAMEFISDDFNAFPKLKFPRVLFLGFKNPGGNIFLLSEKINEAMKESGFIPDKKFHPHITLGRVRRDMKINLSELDTAIDTKINFTLKEFYLMESQLKGTGSEYKVVNKYSFM